MKTLKCDICDYKTQGETFEAWMQAMKPHYAGNHSEFMEQQSKRPEEEQKMEMQKWMIENKERFNNS